MVWRAPGVRQSKRPWSPEIRNAHHTVARPRLSLAQNTALAGVLRPLKYVTGTMMGDETVNNKTGGKCQTHFIHPFMFQFSPAASLVHNPRNRPPRGESLQQNGDLAGLQDELRDFKRVHDQGQEEDLRMALSRTMARVGELVRLCVSRRPSSIACTLLTQKINLL